MLERAEVYKVIDGERDYQEKRFPGHKHYVGSYLTYIHSYLLEAVEYDSRHSETLMLSRIPLRKIVALCVAAMEEHFQYSRADVYQQIETEFLLQEQAHGGPAPVLEISEELTGMRSLLRLAEDACYTSALKPCFEYVLVIATIGVRCLQNHGAPKRED